MTQLFLQLLLGGALIVLSTALQAVGVAVGTMLRARLDTNTAPISLWRGIGLISIAAIWVLSWQMVGVWIWAVTLMVIGAFDQFEAALYFTLAAYTTLGFGDLLPPEHWRILGAMIGANGMLAFGVATAGLVEFGRNLRRIGRKAQDS